MATYTDPFELRRLLVRFTRAPSGGLIEDSAYMTFHFAKLTSGAPDANWLTADYTAVEGRFDTLWTTLKAQYQSWMALAEYRWYKDGPVFSPADRANGPTNPIERTTARAVAGTSAAASNLPPQIGMSLTEVTSIRKRWGRVYLPAIDSLRINTNGRPTTANVDTLVGLFVTFYNGCRTDAKQPVVFSRGRSAHPAKDGSTIGSHVASAYSVDSLRMDDTFDVIRSRRYSAPTYRKTTVLT